MTVAEELFTAAETIASIPQTGRTELAISRDLCRAIEAINDDTWQKLSQPAKDWYNACAAAINGNTNPEVNPAIPIPGYRERTEIPENTPVPDSNLPMSPADLAKGTAVWPEGTPLPKGIPIGKTTKSVVFQTSASEIVREIVIEHYDDWSEAQIKTEAIKRAIEAKVPPSKVTDNVVWTIRTYTKAAVKTMVKMGWVKP